MENSLERIKELNQKIKDFADQRDWDQFHSPKNLSMALSSEVGELLEIFQQLKEEETQNLSLNTLRNVEEEIGDIQIYLFRLADKLGINPIEAAEKKILINEKKYPVDKARGNAKKYTEFEQ